MTENEAIKKVKEFGLYHAIGDLPNSMLTIKAFEMVIKALEEIQQYRAIGTVEEIKRMQRYSALAKKHSTIGQVIDSCAEYEAIGTVEELREAKEKQIPKNPIEYENKYYGCPNCGNPVMHKWEKYPNIPNDKSNGLPYCLGRGQKLDWSDTD